MVDYHDEIKTHPCFNVLGVQVLERKGRGVDVVFGVGGEREDPKPGRDQCE